LLAAALGGLPVSAQSHSWGGIHAPVLDGFLHLVTSPYFILPITGLALLSSRDGRSGLLQAQLLLAAGVATGAAVTFAGITWSGVVPANRLLIILAGLLVVTEFPLPRVARLVLVLSGGALCGHELLATEAPAGMAFRFSIGAVLGAMLLHGVVAGLALLSSTPWSRIAVRIAGSWIAAIGLMYAGFLMMRV